MFRAKMILLFLAIISSIIVILILSQPEFGRTARGERLERVKQSKSFGYKISHKNSNVIKGIFDEKSDRMRPHEGEITVVKTDLKQLPLDGDLYIWFGHSSFLMRLNGIIFLFDPVFYKGSPFSFLNRMFPGTDYYKPSMMPDRIDYIVISHDHWDHLDYETVKELRPRTGHIVCPLGVGEDLEYWGYSKDQIIELDWGESITSEDSVCFNCLRTCHFTGRGLWDPKTIPASWVIQAPTRKVFYSGDGGYSDRFRMFGQQFPDIDLAIMENGQYNKYWSHIHTMPQYLGQEVKDLRTKRFVTVHHSKFCLSTHSWDEPRRNEVQASIESGVPLIVCNIGEIVNL